MAYLRNLESLQIITQKLKSNRAESPLCSRTDSNLLIVEKTLMLGKTEGRRRRR